MQMASGQGLQGAVAATAGAEQASRTLTGLAGQAGQIQGLTALGKGSIASGTSTMLGGLPGAVSDQILSRRESQPPVYTGWGRFGTPGNIPPQSDYTGGINQRDMDPL